MIITDQPSSFEYIAGESEIVYESDSGMHEQKDKKFRESIKTPCYEKHVIPNEIVMKNYNYRTTEIDLVERKGVSAGNSGTVYHYGGQIKNADEAIQSVQVESNRISAKQTMIYGDSNCGALRAGHQFSLSDHQRSELNTNYIATRVTHQGGQAETHSDILTYKNDFESIPGDRAEMYAPQCKTPVPRISGVLTAKIEASGSTYATLDDMGRYKVRMPFDLSNTPNYDGAKYLRLAQPYSGSDYRTEEKHRRFVHHNRPRLSCQVRLLGMFLSFVYPECMSKIRQTRFE